MFEFMICSLFTLVPDYLFRRYVQGKRFGREITFFSVWYELRWGITGCLMLTVLLITTIFYFHPSSDTATLYFRTVPIMPEAVGRVAEVDIGISEPVKKGDVLFKLDSSKQRAAVETARRKVAEINASMKTAAADVAKAGAEIQEARSNLQQSKDELDVRSELQRRDPGVVRERDIEKLQVLVNQKQAAVDAAIAAKESTTLRLSDLLPAEKATAEATLAQAEVDLDKTIIRAGVDGHVEQFALRVGDVVNTTLRPAGVLIPDAAGQEILQAGFSQIGAQVIKKGMVAEASCISKPWQIIPMVITKVQNYIAAGQFTGGGQLVEAQNVAPPGTVLAFLEPIYEGGLDGVTPGSSCAVYAYTSHLDDSEKDVSVGRKVAWHVIDGVALVHASLLRIQALMLPIKTLVLRGH